MKILRHLKQETLRDLNYVLENITHISDIMGYGNNLEVLQLNCMFRAYILRIHAFQVYLVLGHVLQRQKESKHLCLNYAFL